MSVGELIALRKARQADDLVLTLDFVEDLVLTDKPIRPNVWQMTLGQCAELLRARRLAIDDLLFHQARKDTRAAKPSEHWQQMKSGVSEGGRNVKILSLAGKLLSKGYDVDVVCDLISDFNANMCDPPLGNTEMATIFKSVRKYGARR